MKKLLLFFAMTCFPLIMVAHGFYQKEVTDTVARKKVDCNSNRQCKVIVKDSVVRKSTKSKSAKMLKIHGGYVEASKEDREKDKKAGTTIMKKY